MVRDLYTKDIIHAINTVQSFNINRIANSIIFDHRVSKGYWESQNVFLDGVKLKLTRDEYNKEDLIELLDGDYQSFEVALSESSMVAEAEVNHILSMRSSVDKINRAIGGYVDTTTTINNLIFECDKTGGISDKYHTFDELYDARSTLFITSLYHMKSNGYKSWKSRSHEDGSMYEGMFIIGVETNSGQCTYHFEDKYWDYAFFIEELDRAPKFDGHTSADVLSRLLSTTW